MKKVLQISALALCLGLTLQTHASQIKKTTHSVKKKQSTTSSVATSAPMPALPVINFKYKCKAENGDISYQEKQQDKMDCWLMTLSEIKKLQVASLPTDAKTALSPTEFQWARDRYTDDNLVTTNTDIPPDATMFPSVLGASRYMQIKSEKVDGKTQITLVDQGGKKTVLNANQANVVVKDDSVDNKKTDSREISSLDMLKAENTAFISLADFKAELKNRKNPKNTLNKNNKSLTVTEKDFQYAQKLDAKSEATVTPVSTSLVEAKPLALGIASKEALAEKVSDKVKTDDNIDKLKHDNFQDDKKITDNGVSQNEKTDSLDAKNTSQSVEKSHEEHNDKKDETVVKTNTVKTDNSEQNTKSSVTQKDIKPNTSLMALPIPKGFKIDTRTD